MRPRGKSRMLTIRPDDTRGLTGLRATHVIVDDAVVVAGVLGHDKTAYTEFLPVGPFFITSSQNPDVSPGASGRRYTTWTKPDPTADVPFLPYNGPGLANLTDMVKEMERRLTIWPKDEAADASVGRHWEERSERDGMQPDWLRVFRDESTVSVPASEKSLAAWGQRLTEGEAAEGSHETRSGE